MNKYQDTLNWLRETTISLKHNQAYNILQELVDKETPTKTSKSHCGKCNIGYLVQSRGDKYCHVCGYKIDWSEEDE